MPTTRRRHVVTETDHVAQALDAAARRWPADAHNRARLLRHLLEEGIRVVNEDKKRQQEAWLQTVRETSGVLSNISYGPRYLEEMREDWPD